MNLQKKFPLKKFQFSAFFCAFLLSLDLLTKTYAEANFQNPFQLFPGVSFAFTKNFGFAFGMQMPFILLVLINIALITALPFLFRRTLNPQKHLTLISFCLVISGGLGNLADRLFLGYVRDFISVGTFPVFNLADSYVTVGVFLIIVFYDKIKGNVKS